MDMRMIIDYYLHAPLAKARQVHSVGALIIEERAASNSAPRLRSPRALAPHPGAASDPSDPPPASLTPPPPNETTRPTRPRRRARRPVFDQQDTPLPEPEAPDTYGE